MLYSVIICIAYIIGIVWGLYLDLYLGIVSFFLCICTCLIIKSILENYYNKKVTKYKFIYQEEKLNYSVKEINKKLLLVLICFLLGYINTLLRINNFENKYTSRFYF